MKKYITICLLSLFLAATAAKADDIGTIRSFLDNKTDDQAVLHGVYMACLNLTRTGTSDAVPVLEQLLGDERFHTVAMTALINIPGGMTLEAATLPALTPDAELLDSILRDGEPVFVAALKDEKTSLKVLLRAILELKSDKTGVVVLDSMDGLPTEKQAALVANLGERKDTNVVPRLILLAQGEEPLLQKAAIQALGEIGDPRAVNALLLATGSSDAELSKSATDGLKRFQSDELNAGIIALLNADDKKLRLAAMELVGQRQMDAAGDKIKSLFRDSDAEIRAAAYKTFAKISPATVDDIRFVLDRADKAVENEETLLQEAVLTLCRKTAQREAVVALFTADLQKAEPQPVAFFLDCLFRLGGEKAAACVAKIAMGKDDALTDKATQLLGRWTTPEVAPYLIEIAEKHPVERYRNRTLSGYLRVIRQMGLPIEQKVEMAEKALAVAKRDVDKQAAAEVLKRFQAMMKGTPIFDGKTLDGWEILGDEKWFRVEDAAIVGGSLDGGNPRNGFISTKKEYGDFTLYIECRAVGQGANGGVQLRSSRTPAGNEMIGYQADMSATTQYWGAIYDENRRNRLIAEPPRELIERILRPNDWNEYRIVCKGNSIKLYLNGELTVDYTETDAAIPARGLLGLQIQGGANETWYRNIRIEEDAPQAPPAEGNSVSLFDGKTFDGWEFRGNEKWFRVEDGAIVAGTLKESIPHNEYLTSAKEYGDFTLRLESKAIGKDANGGIQFRSFRHTPDSDGPNEMMGYQADMTDTAMHWGKIYHETYRNRFLNELDPKLVEAIVRQGDWNEYVIVCKGRRIQLFLNGTLTADYIEDDTKIPATGFLGLQIHCGGPSEAWYRNIRIEE